MIIDVNEISQQALRSIAEQFVVAQLAENEADPQVNEWVIQTIEEIKSGKLLIEFSQVDGSVVVKRLEDINFQEEAGSEQK